MREQLPACCRGGRVTAGVEDDAAADGVGQGADGGRGFAASGSVWMRTKPRLSGPKRGSMNARVSALSGCAGECSAWWTIAGAVPAAVACAAGFLCSFSSSSSQAAHLRLSRTGAGGDGELGIEHAHHLVGDVVRLMLKRIVGLPDNELRLYCAWEWRCSERYDG